MKKFTSIILLITVFATMFSLTAFAAKNVTEMTVKTDVTSVTAGGTVLVDVELSGYLADVQGVQIGLKYDNTKFSIVTSGRAPWGFDATWYNSTKDGNPANLGYINTPSLGENPAGQINVMWSSNDGYYIDDAGELYGDDKVTTAAKLKFTALTDVATIDATCFEIVKGEVVANDNTKHTTTLNQIEAAEPTYEKVADLAKSETTTIKSEDGATQFENVAIFEANFGLDAYKDAVDYGVKYNSKEQSFKAITGEGALEWVIAFWGVPAEVTPAVETYVYK